MNNDAELVEFYKFLSERAIIDDCCRGEGEAECAVKLYNKSKVKNLDIQRVSNHVCQYCKGTGLVYIDEVIKNTPCPDC